MTTPSTHPTKKKSAAPDQENALSKVTQNHIVEQTLSRIRARLIFAGGQVLTVATDGAFVVVSPYMGTTRFNNLSALQAFADKLRV